MNIRNHAKKIVIIGMFLVIALAGLAVGYGHWQDTVWIDADVESVLGGDICFGYVDWESSDDPGGTCNTVPSPSGYNEPCDETSKLDSPLGPIHGMMDILPPKDVGWCQVVPQEPDCFNQVYNELVVTVGNAYPQYACEVKDTVQNVGQANIIITVELIEVVNPAGEEGRYWLDWIRPPGGPPAAPPWDGDQTAYVRDSWRGDVAVMIISWSNGVGDILDPIWNPQASGDLIFEVLQDAEQGKVYQFTVKTVGAPHS